MRNSFERMMGEEFSDVFKDISDNLEGKLFDPKHRSVMYYDFMALEDFMYKHTCQDTGYGTYEFKKGQIYSFIELSAPILCQIKSRLKFVGTRAD